MNVLVACEFSGIVRESFRRRGHNAWSCDLLASEDGSTFHFRGDVLRFLTDIEWQSQWDLMIAFPPCTHLASSGARWWKDKTNEQLQALGFVQQLINCHIPKVAIENPVGKISSHFRKPNQIIQPWQFGHGETKATCLWLKNLPLLVPTNIVEGRHARVHRVSPSKDRWKERSRTLPGIAEAMAEQWSNA